MDDDKPVDVAIRPVLPSRASMSAFLDQPSPGTILPALMKRTKPRHKKTERLPAPEIKRIVRKRKQNLMKKRAARDVVKTKKNPNRPLMLKNQMEAMVKAMVSLEGSERLAFAAMWKLLSGHSASGRKRVLDALAQVYA